MDEEHLKKLFKIAELSELEYWLAFYSICKKRMVENTRMKLHISRATYFIIYNKILLKLYYTLKNLKD